MPAGPSFMVVQRAQAGPGRAVMPRAASYPGTAKAGPGLAALRDRPGQPWLRALETSFAVMSTIGITRS